MKKTTTLPNPWPVAIIGAFVIFMSAMVAWIIFAAQQRLDLVREDYYEQEIRHQQQIDRIRRTTSVLAEVAVQYDPARQTLTVSLPAAHRSEDTRGCIQFYRPSDASLDHDIPLALRGDGTQRVDVGELRAGLWRIRLEWQSGGHEYYFNQAITVITRRS